MRSTAMAFCAVLLLSGVLAGCTSPVSTSHRTFEDCEAPQAHGPLTDALEAYGARPTVTVSTNQGSFNLTLFADQVPITAKNFLDLASDGFYDGLKFHRVIDGFMIQGGDPNTKEGPKTSWGQGGPGHTIVDEFHPDLRHDAAGTLSMAKGGPNSGGSQFFVTLGPTRHLDDLHSVFGEVASGMDVVRKIGDVPTTGSRTDPPEDRPVDDVVIESVTVQRDDSGPEPTAPTVQVLRSTVPAAPGRTAPFIFFVTGGAAALAGVEARLAAAGDATAGTGGPFETEVEPCMRTFDLPAGQRFVVLAAAHVSGGAVAGDEWDLEFDLAPPGMDPVRLPVTLRVAEPPAGTAAESGSSIDGNYVGLTINGQVFDTSHFDVASDEEIAKAASFNMRAENEYQPFTFEVDGAVIQGFSDLARGMHADEYGALRIRAADAYGESGQSPLAGKTLIFELQVLDVTPA